MLDFSNISASLWANFGETGVKLIGAVIIKYLEAKSTQFDQKYAIPNTFSNSGTISVCPLPRRLSCVHTPQTQEHMNRGSAQEVLGNQKVTSC